MIKILKNKLVIIIILLAAMLIFAFGAEQIFILRKAHSTFENYYAFRGCVQLLDKAADYGVCQTASGQTIKIVKFQNGWYLNGDLPVCRLNLCL